MQHCTEPAGYGEASAISGRRTSRRVRRFGFEHLGWVVSGNSCTGTRPPMARQRQGIAARLIGCPSMAPIATIHGSCSAARSAWFLRGRSIPRTGATHDKNSRLMTDKPRNIARLGDGGASGAVHARREHWRDRRDGRPSTLRHRDGPRHRRSKRRRRELDRGAHPGFRLQPERAHACSRGRRGSRRDDDAREGGPTSTGGIRGEVVGIISLAIWRSSAILGRRSA